MIDLNGREWYDNSTLEQILACPRKAFWNKIFQGGKTAGVGPGANFGTCGHAALARYYHGWGIEDEPTRRLAALRAFLDEHGRLFKDPPKERKHTAESGLAILDHYFDTYLPEDHLYKPIEVELAAAFEIGPKEVTDWHKDYPDDTWLVDGRRYDEPYFDPFLFVIRADGLFQRIATGDLFVWENKFVGNPDYEIKRLKINRQTGGYAFGLSQWPDTTIRGVLVNVVGVYADKFETRREIYDKPPPLLESWRRQTIQIVSQWRRMIASSGVQDWSARCAADPAYDAYGYKLAEILDYFWMNDRSCTNYGLCPFYDGCSHGPEFVANMEPNRWNPFEVK